jgi:cytochrome c oxidase assembly protein subunit 11
MSTVQELVAVARKSRVERAKFKTLWKVSFIAVMMFGFGFAMIPFYKKICEVTGVNQIIQADVVKELTREANVSLHPARTVLLQMDANQRQAGWVFKPLVTEQQIRPGALVKIEYLVENHTGQRVKAQAIPSYSPAYTGQYVQKLECFCFKQQVFEPYSSRRLPVIFRLDPRLPEDVKTLTLSYTLFRIEGI